MNTYQIELIRNVLELAKIVAYASLIFITLNQIKRIEKKADEILNQLDELNSAKNYWQYKDAERELSDIEDELNKRKDWKP